MRLITPILSISLYKLRACEQANTNPEHLTSILRYPELEGSLEGTCLMPYSLTWGFTKISKELRYKYTFLRVLDLGNMLTLSKQC